MDPAERRRVVTGFPRRALPIVRRADVIGLIELGAPDDEYDCVVTEASRLLANEVDDLEGRLNEWLEQHFGVEPEYTRVATMAVELREAWQRARTHEEA